jgi:hypothetical protein
MIQITPNMLLAVVGAIIVIVTLYMIQKRVEGFADGAVPTPGTTSSIPSDAAGSTQTDVATSKPQKADIQALLEMIVTYTKLREPLTLAQTSLSREEQAFIEFLDANKASTQMELTAALAGPDAAAFTQTDTINATTAFTAGINYLRNATAIPGPTSQATTGAITIGELQSLKRRIDDEVLRLAGLRSSSATMLARISQLQKLTADIADMISSVERGVLKLEDVPIKPENAAAFLKTLGTDAELPTLVTPVGTTPDAIKVSPDISATNVESNPMVQELLKHAKYLKWGMKVQVEYQPELASRDRVMDRLEAMEKRLTDLAVSQTKLSPAALNVYLQELRLMQSMLTGARNGDDGVHRGTPLEAPYPTTHTRFQGSDPEYPTAERLNGAQGAGYGPTRGTFPNGEISPDVYIRPGYVMNDETIARRGSASAFDASSVGGLDYKQRSMELCKQIRGANLGEPANFGCIANPDEVGPMYSWRGNFQMVCNRLGDTWGGWYPEMFGCPKYDPASKFNAAMM